jgi:hypothetical protein
MADTQGGRKDGIVCRFHFENVSLGANRGLQVLAKSAQRLPYRVGK